MLIFIKFSFECKLHLEHVNGILKYIKDNLIGQLRKVKFEVQREYGSRHHYYQEYVFKISNTTVNLIDKAAEVEYIVKAKYFTFALMKFD